MQFRLLGTLEVAEQNMAAALGGVKQRSLPAILLIVDHPLRERGRTERRTMSGARLRWSLTGAGS